MAHQASPALRAAILRGAAIEAVFLVGGVWAFLQTESVVWIVGAVVLGGVVMLLSLLQAGVFKAGHDKS